MRRFGTWISGAAAWLVQQREWVVNCWMAAVEEWRPLARFYLEEPGWGQPGAGLSAVGRVAAGGVLISLCAHTMHGVIDPENSFAFGLWLACTVAGGLLWGAALVSSGILGLWIGFWWLTTWRRRSRCRSILRANGWGWCMLSPRLLKFRDRAWGRIPPYEQFATTPWCRAWCPGRFGPLNLYAALALAEELEEAVAKDGRDSETEPAEQKVEELAVLMRGF